MYSRKDSRNNSSLQSVDDARLRNVCRENTNLSDEDIDIILETSHNLKVVHELEGGDIFIDCLTKSGKQAIVVAQYSPEGTNYTRNIVGELMFPNNEPGVFRTLQVGAPSRKLKAIVTGNFLIRQNVSAIRNQNNDVIGVLIVERSIQGAELWDMVDENEAQATKFMQAAYDDQEMERVAKYMKDGMIRFNELGIAVYVNPSARQIFRGINYMDEIMGMPFENLAFGNITFSNIKSQDSNTNVEVTIGRYVLNVLYVSIYNDSSFTGAVMMIEDKTEEKNIEKELILKSTAIEEIHHRVKNNLQTIISLLQLQNRRLEDPISRKAFEDTISRIFSISLTHEMLAYNGGDDIDIIDLLGRLIKSAKNYIIPENLNLSINLTGDNIQLKSDISSTIAMVVNELIQNCIKHAFIGRNKGKIMLTVKKGNPYSTIEVRDDGIGYSKNDIREGSLGHRLVSSMVQDKLYGNLDIKSSSAGTSVTFEFYNETPRSHVKKHKSTINELLFAADN